MESIEDTLIKGLEGVPSCPDCHGRLRYKGEASWECPNPRCAVIEVKINDGKVKRVKRSAVMEVIKCQ